MSLKTTLDQWHTLQAVDQAGSIQRAAAVLNKSHTTLIYGIKKLESQLAVPLVQVVGRRAVLTEQGQALLRRAAPMLEQARDLEWMARQLAEGAEAQITLTMDHLCDRRWLYPPLSRFMARHPGTSVQIRETSLTSTRDAVEQQLCDLAIINVPMGNHLAEAFGTVTMVPVVGNQHQLASRSELNNDDLTGQTQIVIRDLGADEQAQDVGWLKAQQRLTVDNFDHAWEAVIAGAGFCRLPEHLLAQRDPNQFVRLNLDGGRRYQVPMHLVRPKLARTGLAANALYLELMQEAQTRLAADNDESG
ncbi:LysR family transcriptional regulator [Ferrimonas sp. SCSIO 43195]|uniref:LysR family transcriptional regulator n=1 Tax=Ferrimonas sp. SCSIO 43195 TaxID=2822844 RepID=UPI002074F0D7|nr:LysR family transcriptional regulator [Ferrimonas sp. SCSIO 43195]USD36196.1 LysR family transcriptional regulator [Ferrimonas sp. SCSIO 43195]